MHGETVKLSKSTSMIGEFLDTEKAPDTTRHLGFTYNTATLKFLPPTTKHITFCCSNREVVEFKRAMSAHRKFHTRIPQCFILFFTSCNLYINVAAPLPNPQNTNYIYTYINK